MRKLLIIGLLLSGCGTTSIQEQAHESTYRNSLTRCVQRINVVLSPAEYAETEGYRSKIDPDLDNKAAINAVYERKRAQAMDKCRVRAAQEAQAAVSGVNSVTLPVVFVAPLY